jgi:3-deoxy-manno-octulosonate cytidylyltransferase (CMP-KDO synthetase)
MRIIIIIPSRMGSSRFPGKPLAKINGLEMILHVCDRIYQTGYEFYVATPDDEIVNLVEEYGYEVIKTTKDCLTGTDRVAQAVEKLGADIIVNVQGDEPLVQLDDIDAIVKAKGYHYNEVIGSMSRLTRNGPNIVKVTQNAGMLMSLTRQGTGRFSQCGLYAFNHPELCLFNSMPESDKALSLLRNENIELMRFVELGYPVRMVEIAGSPAVDTEEDLKYIQEVSSWPKK